MEKYLTKIDVTEEEAIAFGKKHRLKVLRGNRDGKPVYFFGIWFEPMMGTVYKPSHEGKELATGLPAENS